MSQDANQYQRFHNLLAGKLANSLSPEQINQQSTQMALASARFDQLIEVIHDGSDLRKPYAQKLPNLAKVRSLQGEIINGFNSFNSLVISDKDKTLHLLESTLYSTSDEHYGVLAGGSISASDLQQAQLQRVDTALKEANPGLPVRHLLDRGHDDQTCFAFIDQHLQSRFIIRAKLNRIYPPDGTKLALASLPHQHSQVLDKFVWANKVHQDVNMHLSWGSLEVGEATYRVVRCVVTDRTGKSLFKDPMLLITNELVSDSAQAFAVYRAYLRRSRIESVFKFLKGHLGWETFRVRDYLVIQNVAALCYWAGGYFYENRPDLSEDRVVKWLCALAKSKGKVSLHFLLTGLTIVANHLLFKAFVADNGLSQQDIDELVSYMQ
jgi:hypothetical protein